MKRSGDLQIARERVIRKTTAGDFSASPRLRGEVLPQATRSANRSHDTLIAFREFFQNALLTFRAALREIFDESAYDRFLLRTHGSRSVASYRAFTRERDAAMLKKPRCC
jgi:hypothetical protein